MAGKKGKSDVRGKISTSYDGFKWTYSVSVGVKELSDRKEAERLMIQMMEAAGQQVLAQGE